MVVFIYRLVNKKNCYIFTFIFVRIFVMWLLIGVMVIVFAKGLGDLGSIPGRVILKT